MAPNGAVVAAAFRDLWRELKVEEILARWSGAPASQPAIHSSVLDQMHHWLDNLERAFATEPLPLRDWLPILEAGLANLTVGVVPPALDQVLIGAVDRSRNPELKLAFVLGLNEGIFPATPAPATLLTDTDRAGLEQQGVYLGPTRYQRLGHERYLGYIACTRSSVRLILTCAAQDAKGQPLKPSPFLDHVQRIIGATKETIASPSAWWESEHRCELEAPALPMLNDPRNLKKAQAFEELAELGPVLAKWRQVQLANAVETVSPTVVENIYGREPEESWTDDRSGASGLLRWQIYDTRNPVFDGTSKGDSTQIGDTPDAWQAPAGAREQLNSRLNWQYPFPAATTEAAKTSVTALRRGSAEDDVIKTGSWSQAFPVLELPTPDSSQRLKRGMLGATEIGLAHHLFLEHVALEQTGNDDALRTEAARLQAAGLISAEQVAALDFAALANFWRSGMGRRISTQTRKVKRELAFTARFGVAELQAMIRAGTEFDASFAADEFVVVQGVADLVVLLPEGIWLVDFKTDVVTPAELAAKVRHYEPQLKLYALALARIYVKPVTECHLHFLKAAKTVRLEAPTPTTLA